MASLDSTADWAVLWRKLTQLGWSEEKVRKSNQVYYIPPAMNSFGQAKGSQPTYYSSRDQVRDYLVKLRERLASKPAVPERTRYTSGEGIADRPAKRSRDAESSESAAAQAADGEKRERKRSRWEAQMFGP